MPPWDSWVHYAPALDAFTGDPAGWFEKAADVEGGVAQLLVWVPEVLIDVVSEGIRVSSVEMFSWASEAPVEQPFSTAFGGLRRAGFPI